MGNTVYFGYNSDRKSKRNPTLIDMAKIPNIPFFKTDKAELEFEVFSLKSLFLRQARFKHSLEKPHRVKFYQILYITEGTGKHFIDFQEYQFGKGSVLFISKGQVHAYEVHMNTDGFVILFTEDFLSKNLIHSDVLSLYKLYNYHLGSPLLQPENIPNKNLADLINEMYEEYNNTDTFAKEEIIRLLLKLFLLKIERITQSSLPKKTNAERFIKFGLFRNRVENHYAETRNANEYAKMLNISYKHLNEICKFVTGITAKQLIDNFIILEIKRHLATTENSIKELTYLFGFDEPTNFVKFFKKHTLQTPFQFREIVSK